MLKKLFDSMQTLATTTHRFPLAIVYILGFTGIFWYMTWIDSRGTAEPSTLFKIAYTLINMFFLSVGSYLFTEEKSSSCLKTYGLQILVIVFGGAFYYYFSNNFGPHITSISIGILALLFVAPFLAIFGEKQTKTETLQKKYMAYFSTLIGVILGTMIFGGVIFILGMLIRETINYLFGYGYLFSEFYHYRSIFCFSLLSPLFALTKIPQDTTHLNYTSNKFFAFLLKYIFVPAIFIYFVILYAYSAKVLMHFGDWPRGQITWIVIAFASFGYFLYILASSYENEHPSIQIFRKYFPIAVIPQLFMLFYAIYLRVQQHDITINRYLVVVFGLWLLGISLYFIISKKKYTLVVPLSIGMLSLVISVGPRGFYSVSESRQFTRLENNLKKANILQADGTITPLESYEAIDEQLSRDIASGIRYLCDFNNCKTIKTFFAKELADQQQKREQDIQEQINEQKKTVEKVKDTKNNYTKRERRRLRELEEELKNGPNKRKISNYLEDYLKVERYRDTIRNRKKFVDYDSKNTFPLKITGYDTMQYVDNDHSDIVFNTKKPDETLLFIGENDTREKIILPYDLRKEIAKQKDNEEIIFEFTQNQKKYSLVIQDAYFSEEILEAENSEQQYYGHCSIVGILLMKKL